jgi:hypothetical protein
MPAFNVGVNSTFEQQRQIINSIAVDVFALSSTLSGITSDGLVVTYSETSGVATVSDYASVAGIATYATVSGIATYAPLAGIASYTPIAGVASAINFVPAYANNSGVASYTPIAGYSTISNFANSSSSSTFAFYAGISTYAGSAGVATVAQGLTGSPNVIVGVITASLYVGDGSGLTGLNIGISSYADVSGFSTASGISSYASVAGFATVAGSTPLASYSPVAGFATAAAGLTGTPNLNVGILTATKFAANDAEFTGILTAQSLKAISGYFLSPDGQQSIRIFSGSGSVTFPLGIGSDISVAGIITGTKLYGDASNVTGITTAGITSVVAGANIIVEQTGNVAIVTATFTGSSTGFFEGGTAGIGTTSSVGIGTTIPTEKLTVKGNASIDGNIVLTGEISAPTRIKFGSGGENIKIGDLTGGFNAANVAIGDQALGLNNAGLGHNIAIGQLAYYAVTSGQYNVGVGDRAGQNITTGSYNVILGSYNGQTGLDIRTSSNNIVLSDGEGNIRQYINSSGNVGIKTTIITEALTVAGVVSATSFYGTVPASQLTGALPALDGSALTGVTAVGSGVEIRGNGTPVGVAATFDFSSGTNLVFSSGIATITASVAGIDTSNTSGFNRLNVTGVSTFANNIQLNGTNQVLFGDKGKLYENGTDFYIDEIGTGDLYIRAFDRINLSNSNAAFDIASFNVVGGVSLSYGTGGSPGPRFETTSIGASVYGQLDATSALVGSAVTITSGGILAGVVTATTFSGSGSGLTNLQSGQLTGALPAIDGSALLNVTAAGTGVGIRDNDSPVGSAATINFGPGLDVTFASGIATVTNSSGSLQSRTTVSGVTTSIPNLGIGNTDITGFKSYALMKVGLSTAGWIRLYTDSTSRSNDVTRSVGEDPAPGSGVIAEVVTTGISTQQIITPFAMGGNMDEPVTTTIYVAIQNLSGSTQTITANLTILQLEA